VLITRFINNRFDVDVDCRLLLAKGITPGPAVPVLITVLGSVKYEGEKHTHTFHQSLLLVSQQATGLFILNDCFRLLE